MQMRIVVAAFFLFPSALFFVPQNTRVEVDRLVVYQPQRELALPAGGGQAGSYKIALGSEPVGPRLAEMRPTGCVDRAHKTGSVSPVVSLAGRGRHLSSQV
jgi:hypothetical protein